MFIGMVVAAFASTLVLGLVTPEGRFLNLFLLPLLLTSVMWGYRGYCLDTLKLSLEETGESLYYLGFLFTATSLAAGVTVIGIKLQGRGGAAGGEVVVSFLPAFGTALFTTIVGLCMRVVMSQGVGDIDTVYSDLRDQLHRTAADLKAQADLTTDQLSNLLVILKQKAEEVKEGFAGYADTIHEVFEEKGLPQSAQRLQESADALHRVAEAFSQASLDFDTRLEPALGNLTTAATQLDQTTKAQSAAMRDIAQRVSAIRVSSVRSESETIAARMVQALGWGLHLFTFVASLLVASWALGVLFSFLFP